MKNVLGIVFSVLVLFTPVFAGANVDASFATTGTYTTNTDTQFNVQLSNYQSSNDVAVLIVSDSNVSDVASAFFLDASGWVKLTPYQSGSDVLAKFISDTGFNVDGQRVITMRVNFKTPKTYIVGFSLENADSRVLTSAAAPLTVAGPAVLGQSTTATFTRPLRSGMSGADVTALQNKLTAEGFYSGPVTGFFGAQTRAGVQRYQAAHGITSNGVVGPQTLAALNQ